MPDLTAISTFSIKQRYDDLFSEENFSFDIFLEQLHQDFEVHSPDLPPLQFAGAVPACGQLLLHMSSHSPGLDYTVSRLLTPSYQTRNMIKVKHQTFKRRGSGSHYFN